MCTLITSKGTDIDENIANQNHATRTRKPKPGYLKLANAFLLQLWNAKRTTTWNWKDNVSRLRRKMRDRKSAVVKLNERRT